MEEVASWDDAQRARAAAVGREKVAWYRPEVAAELMYEACLMSAAPRPGRE